MLVAGCGFFKMFCVQNEIARWKMIDLIRSVR